MKLRKAIVERERLDAETICVTTGAPWDDGSTGRGTLVGQHGRRSLNLSRNMRSFTVQGDIAARINRGEFADAERLLESGSRFAQSSTDVATALVIAEREFWRAVRGRRRRKDASRRLLSADRERCQSQLSGSA